MAWSSCGGCGSAAHVLRRKTAASCRRGVRAAHRGVVGGDGLGKRHGQQGSTGWFQWRSNSDGVAICGGSCTGWSEGGVATC